MDKRALKTLMDGHWTQAGWRRDTNVAAEDFAHAKQAGFMFDPVSLTHDALVGALLTARNSVTPTQVADAFCASLSTRRLDMRSALGSYAFAMHFSDHRAATSPRTRYPSGRSGCDQCGFFDDIPDGVTDLNVLNFERFKWGGVRHDHPDYAWFDLRQFSQSPAILPTTQDWALLRQILDIAANLPDGARPSVLVKALQGVIRSNIEERRVLIEILAICGILEPKGHGGYFSEFTFPFERSGPPDHTKD